MPSVLLYTPANRSHIYWADYTAPSMPWALSNLFHYTANSCLDLSRAVEDVLKKKKKSKEQAPKHVGNLFKFTIIFFFCAHLHLIGSV